jgi:hypothetical protein
MIKIPFKFMLLTALFFINCRRSEKCVLCRNFIQFATSIKTRTSVFLSENFLSFDEQERKSSREHVAVSAVIVANIL